MKNLSFVVLFLYASVIFAYDKEIIINNSKELREWCKNESSQYFLAQDITPYNWSSSWWNEGNFIKVKGSWLVERTYIEVRCSIRAGVSERYANIEIDKNTVKSPSIEHGKKNMDY